MLGANYETVKVDPLKPVGFIKSRLLHSKLWRNRVHRATIWVIDRLGPLMVYIAD
jgi:hypothetical protein